ncbi:hypothetical protein PBY51_005291 [Eleginops maclovinus]|uniref:Uncharacterized protein n=1 Tax=Eleginops maclovinus TaxID=56733 RepID=A0AAN8AHA0_ELEMC|nr:hypothetical protein PBY51_005291 [Eleginops maclovinus]
MGELHRFLKSRDSELLISRTTEDLKADWLLDLSLVFAENRMWKFLRKMRNSTLTSGKHLSVICATKGEAETHSYVRFSELERVRGMTGISHYA